MVTKVQVYVVENIGALPTVRGTNSEEEGFNAIYGHAYTRAYHTC